MATNTVEIAGDTSSLLVNATNITGADELAFISGSFRSSPDERRVVTIFMEVGGTGKTFEMRLEFSDPQFIETTITGRNIYEGARF